MFDNLDIDKIDSEDELYHYGRLGMKWGQHIYSNIKQMALNYNKKKRKEKNINNNTKQQIKKLKALAKEEAYKRKIKKKQDAKINSTKKKIFEKYGIDYGKDSIPNKETKKLKNNSLTKKQIHSISDTELRDRINRLQNEKKLAELQSYQMSTGKKFVDKLLKDVLVPAATNAGKDLVTSYLRKYGDIAISSIEKEMQKKKD